MHVITCAKCGHRREATASAPAWQCPACGVAYVKAEQARDGAAQVRGGRAALAGASPASASFFATTGGRLLLVALIALVFFVGKAWLQAGSARRATGGGAAAIEIYTTSYCDTCKIAKAYMRRHGIAYTEYDVEADIDRRREFYDRGGKGTPLIFVRGQRMEGFDVSEFEKLRRGSS